MTTNSDLLRAKLGDELNNILSEESNKLRIPKATLARLILSDYFRSRGVQL